MSVPAAVVCLALMAVVSSGVETDCSYSALLRHLNLTESNYALANVPPVVNWTTPTHVMVDLVIYGILDVDEKAQSVTYQSHTSTVWKNELLLWKPADFCGISRLSVPRPMLWTPDLNIQEDVSDSGASTKSLYIRVDNTGEVVSGERRRMTTTCPMDLRKFPLDVQTCDITFTTFMEPASAITLGTLRSGASSTQTSASLMLTRGEWELKNITSNVSSAPFSDVVCVLTYQVTLARRPLLYVMIFIIPLLFLLLLDVASFFISNTAGEKLGFKVTVLLSISVLMLILKDILPSSSNQLPLIVSYGIAIFLMVGISVLESMLVSFLIGLDEWLEKESQRSPKACEDTRAEAHKEPMGGAGEDEVKPEAESQDVKWPSGGPLRDSELLQRILDAVTAARHDWFSANSAVQGFYCRVAYGIDAVFFTVYIIVIFSLLTYTFYEWMN